MIARRPLMGWLDGRARSGAGRRRRRRPFDVPMKAVGTNRERVRRRPLLPLAAGGSWRSGTAGIERWLGGCWKARRPGGARDALPHVAAAVGVGAVCVY